MMAAELARALGGKRAGRDNLAKCPAHAERTPSLAIRDGVTGVLVHCFAGCPQGAVIDALARRGLWERPRPPLRSIPRPTPPRPIARPDDAAARIEAARRIWRASHDPRATLAEKYLNGRGLDLEEDLCGRVLRFHPRCPFGPDGSAVPALIVAFRPLRDTDDDKPPQAIHRIGLTSDGRKIEKRMLGPIAGCAIKLDADEMVELGLGICEGIETGLAVRATGWRPVWVLGSAGVIATFPVLAGIEALTIFADADPAGFKGSTSMRRTLALGWPRLQSSRRPVRKIGTRSGDEPPHRHPRHRQFRGVGTDRH
jgi:putative DNA primase/helicase